MPARPSVIAVGLPAAALDGLEGDVVAVPADPRAVLAAAREAGPRWLLVGPADAGGVLAAVVGQVLDGTAPVFGLAGVVVVRARAVGGAPTAARASAAERAAAFPAADGTRLPVALLAPDGLGAAVGRFWAYDAGRGPQVPADYAALLASARVSSRMRAVHARRVLPDDPDHRPAVLDAAGLAVLRVLADVVVPQDDVAPDARLDLAARVDAQLAAGDGDGWRFADLPPDAEAYRCGLAELADLPGMDAAAREAVVAQLVAGDRPTHGALTPDQLSRWLQDAVVDLVRQWLAHPANLARVGFDGLAAGGDGDLVGFALLGAGEREPWEPAMLPVVAR